MRVGRCDVREDLWKTQGPEKRDRSEPELARGKEPAVQLFAAAP